ncbi:MAG TPA: SEC-C domain-containing protein [Polyangia bacterium]|nr:SEC-C domain-containing protein [Polyangia bacterium]
MRANAGERPEWVGGRLLPPFFITEGEPYRPELIVWMDLPSGLVVGHHLQDRKAPVEFGATLQQSMDRPLVGPPRRPARVRVASPELAASIRRSVGGDLEVVVAPTPELDDVIEAMKRAPLSDDAPDESYLEDGRVSADAVGDLFRAAELVYRMAPWKTMDEQQLVRVDVPGFGVNGACLSVIGGAGESFGLILFPSLEAFEAFASTVELSRDGQIDFGTTVLALNFERGADLPASMRREISDHGWPVAGPRAYPVIAHRDRDGVPRPLSERDVKLTAAFATSFGSFFLKNKGVFRSDDDEPISESYSGEDDLTVRLTYPYDAFDLFEPDEATPAPARAEPQIARNAPCPCGSGRKYKKCHLPIDEARPRDDRDRRPALHEIDERIVAEMQRFAARRFGRIWQATVDAFEDVEREVQLASPWSVYCASVEGRPIVDWYLAERGRYLSADERGWLEAQQRSWLTIWEVTDVDPGRGLRVRDLLSGEDRQVHEVKGSRVLVKRDAVLGRVVDHDGISVFCGMHPNLLQPVEAAEVVAQVRARLRRKTAPSPERLREEAIGRFMIGRWEDAVETKAVRAHVPPKLTNTDGEKLKITTDVFTFAPENRGQIDRHMQAIEGVEAPDRDDDRYIFLRGKAESKRRHGRMVIGSASLAGSELRVETNSTERADTVRSLLDDACRGLLVHARREQADPLAPRLVKRTTGANGPPEFSSDADLLRAFKLRHYRGWADQPIPALHGKTPREAAKTAQGRAAVDVLLKEFENNEQRSPPEARFDFSDVRKDLGLPA